MTERKQWMTKSEELTKQATASITRYLDDCGVRGQTSAPEILARTVVENFLSIQEPEYDASFGLITMSIYGLGVAIAESPVISERTCASWWKQSPRWVFQQPDLIKHPGQSRSLRSYSGLNFGPQQVSRYLSEKQQLFGQCG